MLLARVSFSARSNWTVPNYSQMTNIFYNIFTFTDQITDQKTSSYLSYKTLVISVQHSRLFLDENLDTTAIATSPKLFLDFLRNTRYHETIGLIWCTSEFYKKKKWINKRVVGGNGGGGGGGAAAGWSRRIFSRYAVGGVVRPFDARQSLSPVAAGWTFVLVVFFTSSRARFFPRLW